MQNAVPRTLGPGENPTSWIMDLVLWGLFVTALAML